MAMLHLTIVAECSPGSSSPVEGQKRGRGRPKKILNNSDILDALDESFREKPKRKRREVNYGSEEGSEGEEDNEEEEMEEELPSKRQRYSDEVIRRSGRERKAPKKFEAVLPQKKKRKKKFASSDSEDKSEEDSDEDYSSHRKYSGTKKKNKSKDCIKTDFGIDFKVCFDPQRNEVESEFVYLV